ncbi:hypothetical protein IWQ60_011221 [Tieghemiomyces parasiticus]|uniref:Integral membrane protein S linking to the trans Golgi network-domain-containing protein n=1 Tax=Tieghemiomyces parasiticus TaxID=78921 RepID=A0A9W8DIN5_9FUNG|nr:hypothetical protein IWQ60_011221 [Tieghemiomyces parasiticus]
MAKYSNSFRAGGWDPIMIIAQIAAVHSISYVTVALLVTAAQILLGVDSSLDHILHYQSLRGDTVFGWTLAVIWLVQAGVGVLLLGYIVERVRLCIDFTLTFYFIHLVMVSIYSHRLPGYFFWWLNLALDAAVMSMGGEWFCMKREMRPIQFGGEPDRDLGNGSGRDAAGRGGISAGPAAVGSSHNGGRNLVDDLSDDGLDDREELHPARDDHRATLNLRTSRN